MTTQPVIETINVASMVVSISRFMVVSPCSHSSVNIDLCCFHVSSPSKGSEDDMSNRVFVIDGFARLSKDKPAGLAVESRPAGAPYQDAVTSETVVLRQFQKENSRAVIRLQGICNRSPRWKGASLS